MRAASEGRMKAPEMLSGVVHSSCGWLQRPRQVRGGWHRQVVACEGLVGSAKALSRRLKTGTGVRNVPTLH